MDDRARQVESFAEAGPQAGGAHALCADYGIALEDERLDAGTRGFARGGTAGGPATDH